MDYQCKEMISVWRGGCYAKCGRRLSREFSSYSWEIRWWPVGPNEVSIAFHVISPEKLKAVLQNKPMKCQEEGVRSLPVVEHTSEYDKSRCVLPFKTGTVSLPHSRLQPLQTADCNRPPSLLDCVIFPVAKCPDRLHFLSLDSCLTCQAVFGQ